MLPNDNKIQNIKHILFHLKHREGMYTHGGYLSILDFINGYLSCHKDFENIDMSYNFHVWLQDRLNTTFSLHWGYYFLHILAKGNEENAKKFLFAYWEEYLEVV
jgi:hypothetical protein